MSPTHRPLSFVKPGKNIRDVKRDEDFEELKRSVLEFGVLQSLNVLEDGTLITGNRRYWAAKEAGVQSVPVSILPQNTPPSDILAIQLAENLHRADVSDADKAKACKEMESIGVSRTDMAKKLGKSASWVSKIMAVYDCCPEVQEAFFEGKISSGDCYGIKGFPDQCATLRLKLDGATREQLSRHARRKTETAVRTPKLKIPLSNDAAQGVVTVSGDDMDLEGAEVILKEALKAVRQAKDKQLDARTAQLFWRDIAAAN